MDKKIIFILLLYIASSLSANSGIELYLDLMKKILINSIYQDPGAKPDYEKLNFTHYESSKRERGRDWPSLAHTMVGLKRLDNVQFCIQEIINNNIPGDFIETGVWRGGTTIFMRAVLKAYDITDRRVWVADSFQGLPSPKSDLYPADSNSKLHYISYLSVSLEEVKNNFQKYNLLDDQVIFMRGWFKDTIPNAPIEKIALLRLDGDMYESTIDVLNHLYPKLSIGGYIIIDDYMLKACKQAVCDYRNKHNITETIIGIDGFGAYWKKERM